MKTLSMHPGICRGALGLLVVAAATACSGQQEAAPPAKTEGDSAVRGCATGGD